MTNFLSHPCMYKILFYFQQSPKAFFSKQNKTLCLTRACPFHSHKIFEIFEMLFYFHQILKNPFSFQIKKLFSDSAERVPPHSLRHRSNHSFNNEGGWEEAMRSKVRKKKQLWFLCLSSANKGNHQNKGKNWMISLLKLWQVGSG